jgi:hypothetical protein
MYKGMYDIKHRFLSLSTNPSQPVRFHQKGLRERLLCANCEGLLNRFESYAADVFNGNALKGYHRYGDKLEITGLDYTKFKLFLLSLLWRFGVTTVPQLRGVELGPHSERVRRMLLAGNPRDPLVYPCLMSAVMWDGEFLDGVFDQPSLLQIHGQDVWRIVVAGIVFRFFVSAQPPIDIPDCFFLQKNGSITVQMQEMTEIGFLWHDICENLEAQIKREAAETGT